MTRKLVRHGFVLAAVLLWAAAPPAGAQWTAEAESPEPAAVSVSGWAVEIFPSVGYSRAILTVSNGETVITRIFSDGERPVIERYDLEGDHLADGVYSWELELVPDARTARELRIAASENGGEAPGAWQRQSGSFAIRGGAFADPELGEAGELAGLENERYSLEAPRPRRSVSDSSALDSDASGMSEEDARAQAPAAFGGNQPYGVGLQSPASYPDGDGGALSAAAAQAELATSRVQKAAEVPHRSIEPGGINGRPEREE